MLQAKNADDKDRAPAEITANQRPVLWRNPADISSRDLFYGPGGKEHQPSGVFHFIKEDLDGTTPKIVIRDQDGVKWKAKLGSEARPEVVATRLTWAAGYFANEDYFVADLRIEGLPAHLHRGQKYVAPDGSLHNVRLKRYNKDEEKEGNRRQKERREYRLPRLDPERNEQAVHVAKTAADGPSDCAGGSRPAL